jgi:hypothetical protein
MLLFVRERIWLDVLRVEGIQARRIEARMLAAAKGLAA